MKTVQQIAREVFPGFAMYKVKENADATRIARRPAYNVWTKREGDTRGKCVGCVISHADIN